MQHWKTTLAGWAAAILNISANGMTLKSFLLSAAVAALGTLAADGKKQ